MDIHIDARAETLAAAAGRPRPAASPGPASSLPPGPLLLRAQSPLAILRLSPTPEVPETLRPGQWQVGILARWNNYFDYDPGLYTIDAETVRLATSVGYGISERIDIGLSVPVVYCGGGVLDHFIEGFERVVGVPNQERKLFPRNLYLIEFHGRNGQVRRLTGRNAGWGLEDMVIAARYQIAPGDATHPALLAAVGINLPTGREAALHSSGGVDEGVYLGIAQRLSPHFYLYGSVAMMRYATTEMAGIQLTNTQESYFTALEYRHSRRTFWLLKALVTSPGAKDFGGFSKRSYEITAGFKRLLAPDLLLEASLLENLLIFANSPDVGFHVGLVWRSQVPTRK